MRFALPTLTAVQAAVAQKPKIGAETNVFASPVEMIRLGTVATDSAGTPTWKARAGAAIPAGELWDIHVRTEGSLKNLAGNPAVSLDVTIGDSVGAGTALATLSIPAWSTDQSKNFPVGDFQDFIPQGVGNSAKNIESVDDIDAGNCANLPANAEFTVWASPPAASFVEIGYCKNVSGGYQIPGSVEIADRYKSAAAVKKGRSESSELTMEFNHISAKDGLARYNGHRVTIWLKIIADKSVHCENIIFTGYLPEVIPNRGDGNDEVMETSAGPCETFMTLTAG
jgi:hypothetical protein